jgi:hypothetical protein
MAPGENKPINISLEPEIAKQMRRAALEKYGNSRSFSKFIEDMFTALDKPDIDIEAIKSEREAYIAEYIKDLDTLYFQGSSACGMDAFRWYRCETCGAEFETLPGDDKYCPSCSQRDPSVIPNSYEEKLETIRVRIGTDDGKRKKVLTYILDELKADHEPLLAEVVEKFNTTTTILAKTLPREIKSKRMKKDGVSGHYFTQDLRSQIEENLSRPWGYDFSWLKKKVEDDGKPEVVED